MTEFVERSMASHLPGQTADVVVIGGGPAGIAAAVQLRRHGVCSVVVLERDVSAGGIPRQCSHPPFGVREFGRVLSGMAYARKLVALAERVGVDVRVRHSVIALHPGGELSVATPEGPVTLRAQRVLIATGVRETPRSARLVSGGRPGGIFTTGVLQSMVNLQHLKPCNRPLIIGTELVSFSALHTARGAGMKPVAMIESGSRITTYRPIDLYPRVLGVPLHYSTEISKIHGQNWVEGVTVRNARGDVRDVDCDGVLFTGRFVPESSLVRGSHLELDRQSGGPAIDQFGRCSDPAYFAAGNLLRPVETAGWCFHEGQAVAGWIAQDLLDNGETAKTKRVRVRCAAPLKLVVPQMIVADCSDGMQHLQLRLLEAATGQLTVKADAHVIWQKRVSTLPERRVLIPLSKLSIPETCTALDISMQP